MFRVVCVGESPSIYHRSHFIHAIQRLCNAAKRYGNTFFKRTSCIDMPIHRSSSNVECTSFRGIFSFCNMQSLTGNRPEDETGCLFHVGINRIQMITLPKNHDSSVLRSVTKSPYPLRYPGWESHQWSLWYSPFSKNLPPRCAQIYPFFFKITKNTEATKSYFTQNYRIMQSQDTTCANSSTLPVVQPQSFNSIFKPLALSFHPTPVSKSTLQPQR